MTKQEKLNKTINVPVELLERLWGKLTDDVFDKSVDGDCWQSKELSGLIEELEKILKDNNSDILRQ